MCALAHYLESEGIATVVIGLIPQHVAAMRPPRTLIVPFPLGRPLGEPGNPALQREVLDAAFALLDVDAADPVIRTLDVEAGPAADEVWACPVSFAPTGGAEGLHERIQREVELLKPWFDVGVRSRGYTSSNASELDIDQIVAWICEFLVDPTPESSPVAERLLAETFKLAIEDLKAFYLEAATSEPGARPVEAVNDWFWSQTAAAELLWDLRTRLGEHDNEGIKVHAAFTLVPATEVARRA